MPTDDRQPSLFRFAQDLGAIKEGVKNLDEGQKEVDRKITGLQRAIGGLVTKEDCKSHRQDLTTQRPPNAPNELQAKPTLLDTLGRKAGAITAILGLLAMAVGGLLVLSRFVGNIERALAAERAAQRRENVKVLHELRRPRQPIIIQQHVPMRPDSGARRRRRRSR